MAKISNLIAQKNALSHIHQQFQSSYDSILFIQGMLSVFCEDLLSTTHTRQVQINTMTTLQGIQLRKIILSMHDNLAREIKDKIGVYTSTANYVQSKIRDLAEAIKLGENCNVSYMETKKYIDSRAERLEEELSRLAKADQEYQKNVYMESLKKQFNFQNFGIKNNIGEFSNYHKNNIKVRLQSSKNQQIELQKFMVAHLTKHQFEIDSTFKHLKKIQQDVSKFDYILAVLGYFSRDDTNNINMKMSLRQDTNRESREREQCLTTSPNQQKYSWTSSDQRSSGRNQRALMMRQTEEYANDNYMKM